MNEERTFITDDDGHWYLIAPDDKETFLDLLDRQEYEELENMFGYYRSSHPSKYTIKVVD